MIATAHIGELWRRFNAAGDTPVVTAFGGVIVTGITGYLLQERKSEIEDSRLKRDAKRLRGEELYHLFDEWLMGIRKAAESLAWKIRMGDHTLKDFLMLANIDFPSMKPAVGKRRQGVRGLYDCTYHDWSGARPRSSASTDRQIHRAPVFDRREISEGSYHTDETDLQVT
jgi:hypothetical protein